MRIPFITRPASALALAAAGLVATTIFAAQLSPPTGTETKTAKLVAGMIGKFHISRKPLDDRLSEMILKRYLKDLDPQKMYLLQSDVAEFEQFRTELDNLIAVGNTDFAYKAFNRYLQRLDERMAVVHKLIELPHDFTVDEELSTDWDNLPFAKDAAELNERWRRRIKYELLVIKLDETRQTDDPKKRLHKRYDMIKKAERDTLSHEVLERYLSAVAHCYDPHSSYMSPETVEDFNISMKLSLQGIGAALRSEDGFTTVAEVVDGGAAAKDGRLLKGDKILAVAQDDGEYVDIVEMKLNRVVRLIRGPGGTKVKLKVQKATSEVVEYVLTRQTIELKSAEVKGEVIPLDSRIPGRKAKIGVLNIPSFYRDFNGAQLGIGDYKSTVKDVQKVLAEFRKEGVEAVVVDLRMNGGGALSEAIEVSGLFIDDGPVVQVKEQDGNVKSHNDEERGEAWKGPLVVVCNRLSASASEIFAGVIKDYQRGIVVGDTTTHGKGTVQNVMPVSERMFRVLQAQDLGALKLTINQFYRVNGDSTQNRGVESDVVLPSLVDHMDLGESFLDNALAFDHINPAQHKVYPYVNSAIVNSVREASARRVAADPKFQQTVKEVDRYLARKSRKAVSLNEEKLRQERAADKVAEEIEKEQDEQESGTRSKEIFPKNEYNAELLQITADYLAQIRQQQTVAR